MPRLPGHLYSPTACRTTHALPYVFSSPIPRCSTSATHSPPLPPPPPHLRHRRPSLQMPILWRPVCQKVIFPLPCPCLPSCSYPYPAVICYRAMSTSATPVKNPFPLPARPGARAQPPLPGPPPQSRPAISASNPVSRAMAAIRAVCPSHTLLSSFCDRSSLRISKVRATQVQVHFCKIPSPDRPCGPRP